MRFTILSGMIFLTFFLSFVIPFGSSIAYIQSNDLDVKTNTSSFDFTLTNGTIVNLDNYNDKPILLEWSASWCSVCELNLGTIETMYDDYKDLIHILSISYGGSGDDLNDVISMKGNRPWDFGLDHTNYANTVSATNGDTWILYPNLTVAKIWKHAIVQKSVLQDSLDSVLLELNLINETRANNSITPLDLWVLDFVFGNPLFLAFAGLVVIAIMIVAITKIRKK
ncbi:MAG: peroxiredoxin family protein [Candidatus Hodarchaeota archaeon]